MSCGGLGRFSVGGLLRRIWSQPGAGLQLRVILHFLFHISEDFIHLSHDTTLALYGSDDLHGEVTKSVGLVQHSKSEHICDLLEVYFDLL